jgi:hypothetical protein
MSDIHGASMVKKLLARYRAKRDFTKTAEPSGNAQEQLQNWARGFIRRSVTA